MVSVAPLPLPFLPPSVPVAIYLYLTGKIKAYNQIRLIGPNCGDSPILSKAIVLSQALSFFSLSPSLSLSLQESRESVRNDNASSGCQSEG